MTTISAGAAAGLLVALMVISTSEATLPAAKSGNGFTHPGDMRGFSPQPASPAELSRPVSAIRAD